MINIGIIIFAFPLALSLLQVLKYFPHRKKEIIRINHESLTKHTFLSIALCFAFLIHKFVVTDLSYNLVFMNSHKLKPMLYKITGVWGNHEGSMLLFIFILSAYSFIYSRLSKFKFKNDVLGFQAAIIFLLMVYTYFTSNPFDPLPAYMNAADGGMGLNPLLQDIGLAIHPPILYIGFAGFSLAFSTALVVLKKNIKDKSWSEFIRPWILFSWSMLSIGVGLGAWWAYRELGWGGFWFWDPVENISLLPWLFSCALIHLILTTKKFNRFAMFTILLSITTFLSALIGFFLVRSGLLSSVHTFASDPTRGLTMLAVIFIISSYAMILFGKKYTEMKFKVEGKMGFVSREVFILFQAILLIALAVTIMLGIFYPMILEMFTGERISVGEPYFNSVFIPIALGLIVIMVFAPILKWQREKGITVIKKSLFSFILSIVIAVYLRMHFEQENNYLAFATFCCLWLSISAPEVIFRRLLAGEKVSKGFTAMIISHTGFGLLGLAITLLTTFEYDGQFNLRKGEKTQIKNTEIALKSSKIVKGDNYLAQRAEFEVNNGIILSPENRIYFPDLTKTHEAEISYSIWKDIYVVMGQVEDDTDNRKGYVFPTRLYVKPFIMFVWLAVLMMAFGGFLALLPKKK